MLEEFIWKALDLLDKLDDLGEILTNPELPEDLSGAQYRLEEHNHLKRRVQMAPVEQLAMEGHRILQEITGEGQQHGRSTWGGRVHIVLLCNALKSVFLVFYICTILLENLVALKDWLFIIKSSSSMRKENDSINFFFFRPKTHCWSLTLLVVHVLGLARAKKCGKWVMFFGILGRSLCIRTHRV